jgi:hypothetical protein
MPESHHVRSRKIDTGGRSGTASPWELRPGARNEWTFLGRSAHVRNGKLNHAPLGPPIADCRFRSAGLENAGGRKASVPSGANAYVQPAMRRAFHGSRQHTILTVRAAQPIL